VGCPRGTTNKFWNGTRGKRWKGVWLGLPGVIILSYPFPQRDGLTFSLRVAKEHAVEGFPPLEIFEKERKNGVFLSGKWVPF